MLKYIDRRFLGFNIVMVSIGGALLFAIVAASFIFTTRTLGQANDGFQAGTVDRIMLRLQGSLADAESGQRGFILTNGDPSYLQPYLTTRSRFWVQFEELKSQIALLPADLKVPDVEGLAALARAKFDEMQRTVDLVQQGRQADAAGIVNTDEGQRLMDEARDFVTRFLDVTRGLRNDRIGAMRDSFDALTYLTTFSALMVVLLFVGAFLFVIRHTREIEAARVALAEANDALAMSNSDLEQRIEERTRGLRQANDEVQRYAYIVSHDLRAPLVNIMGFTGEIDSATKALDAYLGARPVNPGDAGEVLAREAVQVDIPEALGFIRSSMTRMDGLINEILKLSRLGRRQLEPEPTDTGALVAECIDTIRHRFDEAGADVRVVDGLPTVTTDRSALQQIFTNLLDNAAKYLDASRPGRITVTGHAGAFTAEFEVTDNGRGIPETDYERIFDLFRRSGVQDRPGEGIGLAHVRSLVRRLGGDITVSSDGQSGTTFRFTIARDLRVRLRSEQT